VLVPRQSEYAPQQTLQQYQTPIDVGMPMNVSMNTDGFPENVLTTNQTTSIDPNQIPSTNNINPFSDTSLIGRVFQNKNRIIRIVSFLIFIYSNAYYIFQKILHFLQQMIQTKLIILTKIPI